MLNSVSLMSIISFFYEIDKLLKLGNHFSFRICRDRKLLRCFFSSAIFLLYHCIFFLSSITCHFPFQEQNISDWKSDFILKRDFLKCFSTNIRVSVEVVPSLQFLTCFNKGIQKPQQNSVLEVDYCKSWISWAEIRLKIAVFRSAVWSWTAM